MDARRRSRTSLASSPNDAEDLMSEDVYNAMLHNDLAKLPVAVLKLLQQTQAPSIFPKMCKHEHASQGARDGGNLRATQGDYFNALKTYNIALLFAPNSEQLRLAYNNRSILFYKIEQYKACLRDIYACLKIGAGDLERKLHKRKARCMKILLEKNEETRTDKFFTFKSTVNSDIPCTTEDVGITFDSVVPKVIAVNDISLGTLVAMETAYVGLLSYELQLLACYHCHRLSLNLMPCTNCCVALFCNEQCRKECMEDVHRTECNFMEYMDDPVIKPNSQLAFKAALKMRQHSSSWSDFIELSKNVGNVHLNSTSYRDVYNTNNKFLLHFKEKNEPKYGPMFNFGYVCATYIQLMFTKPEFWPENLEEKQAAVDAFARLMMKLFLHLDALNVSNCCEGMDKEVGAMYPTYAFCSFIGQLKHNCDANLLTVGLGNKIAAVAVKDIPEGSELTISYVSHAYEHREKLIRSELVARAMALYRCSVTCECHVCRGVTPAIQYPSVEQMSSFQAIRQTIDLIRRMERKVLPYEMLELAVKVLKDLKDVPQTKEFQNTLLLFLLLLRECQQLHLRNYLPLNMKDLNLVFYYSDR